jgi:RNase P subunit RPR2
MMRFRVRCLKCGSPTRIKVNLFLDIPWRYFHRITKQAIRNKDVKIDGAGWQYIRSYCSKCGWNQETEI